MRDETTLAERDAVLAALCGVMATLSTACGGPEERAAWGTALALLAQHGMQPGARAMEEFERSYAEWESRR